MIYSLNHMWLLVDSLPTISQAIPFSCYTASIVASSVMADLTAAFLLLQTSSFTTSLVAIFLLLLLLPSYIFLHHSFICSDFLHHHSSSIATSSIAPSSIIILLLLQFPLSRERNLLTFGKNYEWILPNLPRTNRPPTLTCGLSWSMWHYSKNFVVVMTFLWKY